MKEIIGGLLIICILLVGCTTSGTVTTESVEGTFQSVSKKNSGWIIVILENDDSTVNIEFGNLKADYWISKLNSYKGKNIKITYEVSEGGFAGPFRTILKIEAN